MQAIPLDDRMRQDICDGATAMSHSHCFYTYLHMYEHISFFMRVFILCAVA